MSSPGPSTRGMGVKRGRGGAARGGPARKKKSTPALHGPPAQAPQQQYFSTSPQAQPIPVYQPPQQQYMAPAPAPAQVHPGPRGRKRKAGVFILDRGGMCLAVVLIIVAIILQGLVLAGCTKPAFNTWNIGKLQHVSYNNQTSPVQLTFGYFATCVTAPNSNSTGGTTKNDTVCFGDASLPKLLDDCCDHFQQDFKHGPESLQTLNRTLSALLPRSLSLQHDVFLWGIPTAAAVCFFLSSIALVIMSLSLRSAEARRTVGYKGLLAAVTVLGLFATGLQFGAVFVVSYGTKALDGEEVQGGKATFTRGTWLPWVQIAALVLMAVFQVLMAALFVRRSTAKPRPAGAQGVGLLGGKMPQMRFCKGNRGY